MLDCLDKIMSYSTKAQILINGRRGKQIVCGRSLRLSLLLFVLVTDRLNYFIGKAEDAGLISEVAESKSTSL